MHVSHIVSFEVQYKNRSCHAPCLVVLVADASQAKNNRVSRVQARDHVIIAPLQPADLAEWRKMAECIVLSKFSLGVLPFFTISRSTFYT